MGLRSRSSPRHLISHRLHPATAPAPRCTICARRRLHEHNTVRSCAVCFAEAVEGGAREGERSRAVAVMRLIRHSRSPPPLCPRRVNHLLLRLTLRQDATMTAG